MLEPLGHPGPCPGVKFYLAEAHGYRCDLDALVLGDVLQGLFKGSLAIKVSLV